MAESGTGTEGTAIAVANARRSTRVFQAVPLSVSGQSRIGNLFLESTSAVAVNCHGCLYPSRHEYRHGSWVTIEVPNQQVNALPHPVRAQVKFVRLPRSPQELYLVGVEFESPANVWGIKAAPDDWLRFPNLAATVAAPASSLAGLPALTPAAADEQKIHVLPDRTDSSTTQDEPSSNGDQALGAQASAAPSGSYSSASSASVGGSVAASAALTPDELLRLVDGKVRQAAEKAVAAALTSRLNTAVNQAVKAIENFSQASLRQVEAHCSQYRETLVATAREDLLGRMNADVSEAGEQLRTQVEAFSVKAFETVQQLEKSAAQVQPVVAAAQNSLHTTARELQDQFNGHVRETLDRGSAEFNKSAAQVQPVVAAAQNSLHTTARELQDQFAGHVRETLDRGSAEFNDEIGRISQRQLARLAEKAHAAGGEAARVIDARSTEARSQLESAAGAALGEFHQRAGIEIDLAVDESRKSISASLATIATETSAAWEARQRACQQELERASDQQVELFRRRLTGIVNSSLVAAMSAVSEHSNALIQSLAKDEEGQ
jgi:hypothetical protein